MPSMKRIILQKLKATSAEKLFHELKYGEQTGAASSAFKDVDMELELY